RPGRALVTSHHAPATRAAMTTSHARNMNPISADHPHIMSIGVSGDRVGDGARPDAGARRPARSCGPSGVALGILLELRLAVRRAEIEFLPLVLRARPGLLLVHLHPAHGILRHVSLLDGTAAEADAAAGGTGGTPYASHPASRSFSQLF